MRLNIKAFSLACGFTWGIIIFVLSWWIILFGHSTFDFLSIGELTRGYSPTPVGSIVALCWGFFDGFIIGLMFSAIYNLIVIRHLEK